MSRIHKKSHIQGSFVVAAALVAMAGSGWQRAHADITVVADVNVTTGPNDGSPTVPSPPNTRTITTMFRADKARTDLPDGSALIFDNDTDSLYQIDPQTKTYHVGSINQIEKFKSLIPLSPEGQFSIDSHLDFNAPDENATYLGAQSKRTDLAGEAQVLLFPYGYAGPGYGPPPPPYGGYPASDYHVNEGSNSAPRDPHGPTDFPVYDVTGGYWQSDSVKLPKERHIIVLPLALQMIWGGVPFVRDLVMQLDKSHDIPLHSQITVVQTYAPDSGNRSDHPADEKITTTYNVKSISYAENNPALFEVPSDYTNDDLPVSLPQLMPSAGDQGP